MTDDTHVDRTSVAVFGGRLAKGLAVRLAPDREVRLVSDDRAVVESGRSEPFAARHVDYATADLAAVVGDVDVAVVATERDRAGLLVAQTLAVGDEVDRVLVRFDDPDYEPVFSGLDCDVLDLGSVLHDAVESTLEPTSA